MWLKQLSNYVCTIATTDQIQKVAPKYCNQYEQYQSNPVGFLENIIGGIYTDDIKILVESVRDNTITIAKSANATGKTHGAARTAVWFFLCFQDSQVYTAAAPPEKNLKDILWGEIGSIVLNKPELFEGFNCTTLHIKRSANSFLTGVTIPMSGTPAEREARFNGKHAPYLLFIIDEGDAVPVEVYHGIEACMSGGFVRLLILFNPRDESGPVYKMEKDGIANVVTLKAFNHPNVVTGKDIIPGAVTRNITARRISEWSRKLHSDEKRGADCFELPKFLEGYEPIDRNNKKLPPLLPGWYKVIEPTLSYMVLAEYPSQSETQLISKEWIDNARSRWDLYVMQHGEVPPQNVNPRLGGDVAEFGVDKNVCALRYGGWVPRMQSWKGVDVLVTGDRFLDIIKQVNPDAIQIDATGVGSGVAPHISRGGYYAEAVKVASSPTYKTELGEFNSMRDQLAWSCREWLRTNSSAMLPPNEELIEEMRAVKYDVKNGKIKITAKDDLKKVLRRSPDWFDALCLTFSIYGTEDESLGFGGFA